MDDCRYVVVGGGNSAGYAAKTFVEHGQANGKLCIVTKEVILVKLFPSPSNYILQQSRSIMLKFLLQLYFVDEICMLV